MMTKEEVASIVKYCNDNGVSYKARLSEPGVPEWKFFESKRRHVRIFSLRFQHTDSLSLNEKEIIRFKVSA